MCEYIDVTRIFNRIPNKTVKIYLNIKRRTKKYKFFLEEVSKKYNIPVKDLIKPGKGYYYGQENETSLEEAHTWVHPEIARDMAKWSKDKDIIKRVEDIIIKN